MRHLSIAALVALPALCASCSDATASLGTDETVAAGQRLDSAPVVAIEPAAVATEGDVDAAASAESGDGSQAPNGASESGEEDGEPDQPRASEGFDEAVADLQADAEMIRNLKPVGDGEASEGPEELEDGTLLISYADLSLVGYDVDALLDPEDDSEEMPESITQLDGKRVAIEGYMLPMEWKRKQVISFMLVRDMAGCCFGGMPQPDEWIDVSFPEGKGCDYYPYIPVLVTGVLTVGGELDDLGYVTGAYSIVCEDITDEW